MCVLGRCSLRNLLGRPRCHCKCPMGSCFSRLPSFDCAWLVSCFCPKFLHLGSDGGQSHHGIVVFPSKNVYHVTSVKSWEEKLSQASQDGKIVVANFSASWSHPCRDIMPTFSELADKYSSLMFLIVDADELAELSTSWNVNATPTFYFLNDGRQVDKLVGADKSELKRKTAAMADLSTN